MEVYGSIKFDDVNHPGKMEIDENNNITVTIFESDLIETIDIATGNLSGEFYEIHNMYLIDNGIGFYKMQAKYVRELGCLRELLKNEHKKFRFRFNRLREWLDIRVIEKNDNIVKINIPRKIYLIQNKEMQIYIKYYKEKFYENYYNALERIEINPYIVVESVKNISFEQIYDLIQKITRFFALLIGCTDNVSEIFLYDKVATWKELIEGKLYINLNFANNNRARDGYSVYNIRTKYKNVKNGLKERFSKWMDLLQNEDYNRVVTQYYSYYRGINLEENFLAIVRSIEELYELEHAEENNEKESKIIEGLEEFYNSYEEELKAKLSKSISKKNQKKYAEEIKKIHNDIINSFVERYNMRKPLSDKIKESDETGEIIKMYNECHVINKNEFKDIYDSIARTRNYHTHLSSRKDNIIDYNYLDSYSRTLEKILVRKLMILIGIPNDIMEVALKKDQFLNLYKIVEI